MAFVGGTLTSTVSNASTTTGTEYNAIRIWPVPGTAGVLNYRYVKRQSALSAATDQITGVPLAVEDLIVQLAYARQLQSVQMDPRRGFEMEARVLAEVERKHRNHRFDPKRHRTMKSARRHRTAPERVDANP